MLLISNIFRLQTCTESFFYNTHIQLRNLNQLTALRQYLEHLNNSVFLSFLVTFIQDITYMHLCTNTINLSYAISLPFLNPVYQTLCFLIAIPP